jgi:hypothetical protein
MFHCVSHRIVTRCCGRSTRWTVSGATADWPVLEAVQTSIFSIFLQAEFSPTFRIASPKRNEGKVMVKLCVQ